jgi:hypothetical protein
MPMKSIGCCCRLSEKVFERGEKAFHVVDPEMREAHLRRLDAAGIDVTAVLEEGQFELLDWNEHYFPDGEFDETRMMAKWDTVLEGAVRRGYPRTRVIAHLEWFQRDVLLQYEAKFNLVPRTRDPVICTYDLSKHSGAFIMDVMRTHPMIIVGASCRKNRSSCRRKSFYTSCASAAANNNIREQDLLASREVRKIGFFTVETRNSRSD